MKNPHSSNVRRCFAAFTGLLVALAVLSPAPAAAQLNMWFTNTSSYSNSDIWITVQRGQGATSAQTGIAAGDIIQQQYVPDISYWNGSASTNLNWRWLTNSTGSWFPGTAGSIYSESVQLSYILTNGNGLLTWMSNAPSAAVIVSFGANPFSSYTPTQTTVPTSNNYTASAASSSATPDPNYKTAWQPFEITYGSGLNGAPQTNDQGNLTAINFFTAAIKLQSFTNADATGPVLQERGFFVPTSQIAAGLSNVASGPAVNGVTAYVTNASGDIVRYIGPSQFGASPNGSSGYGTYPSFDSYFSGAGSSNALFTNNSAYNTTVPPLHGKNYTNKNVSFAFNNSVTNTGTGYALNPTGTITVVTAVYTNGVIDGTPTTTAYSNIVFNVNPNAQGGQGANVVTNIASQFVYLASWTAFNGGVFTNNDGSAANYSWFEGGDWNSFTSSMTGFVDGGGSDAMADITAQIAGEIASGFQAGFVGSTNPLIAGQPSDSWWSNGIVNAFGGSQPTNLNYDAYGGIIADASSNSVYGLQYSDRFDAPGQSPLMNSYQLNGTNIGSWLITIQDPITPVPEPSTYALLALGGAGLAGYMLRRRRR